MAHEVIGKLTKKLDVVKGTSKSGKGWCKQNIVVETSEKYNNLYCFEVFGEENVNALKKINVGDYVEIGFNVKCREYNGKYYTDLGAWRLSSSNSSDAEQPVSIDAEDDLPF